MLAALCCCPGCDRKQPVAIGDKPPEITGSGLQGESVGLDRFKGRVVVLYFWADSCCRDRLKLLEPFYRRNKERGLAILAVNAGSPAKLVESFGKSTGLTFTLLADEHSMSAQRYGVFGFPTVFIIDGTGIVRQKVLGEISVEQLQKLVERQFAIQKEVQAQFEKNRPR
jgi:peroxiredoxin